MEAFDLVFILLACVIASSVFDQIVGRVSLPLIQIAIGVAVALVIPSTADVHVDSELFLVLFIAPLLFNEARESSRKDLWDNKGAIISLAIGLVLITVLVVGFVLHAIVPSIPLAAAFACAAALGPTDAAAVGALGATVSLSDRQKTLLSGESLINDASGVVSFQFAIAAAVTGSFSAVEAGETFLVLFFGGIAAGIVFGWLAKTTMKVLRRTGFENTTVHVIYEVFTPFAVFLAAEAIGVSGILAVVAAGLIMVERTTMFSTSESVRRHMVSSEFWETIVFLINGVIFVLLGMQLPQAVSPTLSANYPLPLLLGLVVAVTAMVMGCRFVWLSVMELLHRNSETGRRGSAHPGKALKRALIMTIAGPKGAVTLSIILTIPLVVDDGSAFPERNLIIFLTAGVILLSLLIADAVLPLLAPQDADETDEKEMHEAGIMVLVNTINELSARLSEDGNSEYDLAIHLAIARCRTRLTCERLGTTSCSGALTDLMGEVLMEQKQYAARVAEGCDGAADASLMLPYNAVLQSVRLDRNGNVRVSAREMLRWRLKKAWRRLRPRAWNSQKVARVYYDSCLISLKLEFVAIGYLNTVLASEAQDTPRAQAAEALFTEHQAAFDSAQSRLLAVQNNGASVFDSFDDPDTEDRTAVIQQVAAVRERIDAIDAKTLQSILDEVEKSIDAIDEITLETELDEIGKMYTSGQINRQIAQQLREEVYLMQMSLNR